MSEKHAAHDGTRRSDGSGFTGPIDNEILPEEEIIRQLRSSTPAALFEIARSSRNPHYLRILAGNAWHPVSDSGPSITQVQSNRIKSLVADNPYTHSDTLIDLATDPLFFGHLVEHDHWRIRAILNHANAGAEVTRALADRLVIWDGELKPAVAKEIKEFIIRSPHIDETILLRYRDDPEITVRSALAGSSIADLMAWDASEEVRKAAARNPRLSQITLRRLLSSSDPRVRLAACSNRGMTLETVEAALRLADGDDAIPVQVAQVLADKDTPMLQHREQEVERCLIDLLDRRDRRVNLVIVCGARTFTLPVLDRLADQDPEIQVLASQRHDLCPPVIKKLYDTEHPAVRRRLIMNPNVALPASEYSRAIQLSMAERDGWETRLAIAQKRNLGASVVRELARDPNVRVRAEIAGRGDFTLDPTDMWEVFEPLCRDPFPYVRGAAAGNPSLPADLVASLAEDRSNLAEGLVDENGELVAGITQAGLDLLRSRGETVLRRLARNPRVLGFPALIGKLLRDFRYHGLILDLMGSERVAALERFEQGDFLGASSIQQRLAACHPPFGVLFELGNSLYWMRDVVEAEACYQRSVAEHNHIGAILALYSLSMKGEVPESLLRLDPRILTILQNLHHACPVHQDECDNLLSFIDYMNHPHPGGILADPDGNRGASPRFVDLLSDPEIEQLVALQLWALVDMIRQGWVGAGRAVGVIERILEKISCMTGEPGEVADLKELLLEDVVYFANLPLPVKHRLRQADRLHLELFLRGGAWALMRIKEYQEFRQTVMMDNVPPCLREDLLRSVWLELTAVARPVLFADPPPFRRLSVIGEGGFFGGNDQGLQVSLALSGGAYHFGVGNIDSVVRSEGAHWLTSGIFRSLGHFRVIDELQDRALLMRFPRELNDPELAPAILGRYAEHDRLLLELGDVVLTLVNIDELRELLKVRDWRGVIEDYALRNAGNALESRPEAGCWASLNSTALPAAGTAATGRSSVGELQETPVAADDASAQARRAVGEGVYYLFRDEPNLAVLHSRLPELVDRMTVLKRGIERHPWGVRLFFEGGSYLASYHQPFPLPIPPPDPEPGIATLMKLSTYVNDEHYCGEWLDYQLRLRVRELVRDGRVCPGNLEQFYATSAILLSAFVDYGKIVSSLQVVAAGPSPAELAVAARELFCLLHPNRGQDQEQTVRWGLAPVAAAVRAAMVINPIGIKRLLEEDCLRSQVSPAGPVYPRIAGWAAQIVERLEAGGREEVALATARLISFLRELNATLLADQLAAQFMPIDEGEPRRRLITVVQAFLARHQDFGDCSVDSIYRLVGVIRRLTPEFVFQCVQERRVKGAEPEKAVVAAVAQQMAGLLLATGEIGLARLQDMLTSYYETDYRHIKGAGPKLDLLSYTSDKEDYWVDIGQRLFAFLSRYDFLDMDALMETFAEKAGLEVQGHN